MREVSWWSGSPTHARKTPVLIGIENLVGSNFKDVLGANAGEFAST